MCCGGMALQEIPANEKDVARIMAHAGAPAEVSPEQNEALLDEETKNRILLAFETYIWVDKDGSATCTRCGETFTMHYAAHKGWGRCPACGTEGETRLTRYGRKRMQEEFYAVRWMKSRISKDALVMIGYFCRTDYDCPDPGHARRLIVPILVDTFRYGKGATRIQRSVWGYVTKEGLCSWNLRRDVRAIGAGYFGHKVDVIPDHAGFMEAIGGTPFRSAMKTMTASERENGILRLGDQSELMAAIAKRPWMEYLAKAGFRRIANGCIYREQRGLLNPRGKNPREILRLTKDRYAELKGKREDIDLSMLQAFQVADGAGVKISLDECNRLAHKLPWDGDIKSIADQAGRITRELVKYLLKNHIRDLLDYWRMAREAGIDLSLPEALMPPDLTRAHDALVEMRNEFDRLSERGEAERLQEQLDLRLEKLEKSYCFCANGLVLRPARQLTELIDEGNTLGHCVGSYIKRYAEGGTDICFLRRAESPDTPWRTIELRPDTHEVLQDRGYKNDRDIGFKSTMTPELRVELDAFWAKFYGAKRLKTAV